jgi:hypothetical protein
VSSIENRLRRLEERGRGGRCPECDPPPEGHGYMVLIDETGPEESFEGYAEERCGRSLDTVIRVVYDPPAAEEEGGGGVSYGAL